MKEDQHIEFKESWHDEYTRYISVFCNTEGNVLYIGLNNNGTVIGIEHLEKLIEKLSNFIAQKTGIMPFVHLKESNGKESLEIEVQPFTMPISVHGRYYVRSGSVTSELQGNQLNMFLAAKMGLTWESVVEEDFSLDDIDIETVERFKLLAKDRVPSIEQETDILALMKRLNLVVGGRFKRAAVVLFGKNVQKYVLQAWIKIGKLLSETEVLAADIVEGNLIQQVNRALDILRTKYLLSYISYEGILTFMSKPIVESFYVADEILRPLGEASQPSDMAPKRVQRMSKAEMMDSIVACCSNIYLTIEEIASFVNRNPTYIKNESLSTGCLMRLCPNIPNHPRQAYKTKKEK